MEILIFCLVFLCFAILKIGKVSVLERKIAQMLMIGFYGDDLSGNPEFIETLIRYNPGGVILYNRPGHPGSGNITSREQLRHLTSTLQQYSSTPLFIAVDQEGGNVSRLKPEHGFCKTVTARFIGEINLEEETARWAETIALDLAKSGINLNLAPVIDLNFYNLSPAIGKYDRCFSDAPTIVTKHAEIFCRIMAKHKIYSCLKHFPGHGSAKTDTHLATSDISSTWKPEELEPYRQLITRNAADLIMVCHVHNHKLDELYPASLSKSFITGLLRQELGWQGVVITDDLQMKAVADYYFINDMLSMAILAGNDLLLFGNSKLTDHIDIAQLVKIIKKLVISGEIPESIINRAYEKICRLKAKFIDI